MAALGRSGRAAPKEEVRVWTRTGPVAASIRTPRRALLKQPKHHAAVSYRLLIACPEFLLVEFDEQCLGLSQIGRVEALSEPPIDRRQKIAGLGALVLVAPEPDKARSGAQFQGLRILLPRLLDGPLVGMFCSIEGAGLSCRSKSPMTRCRLGFPRAPPRCARSATAPPEGVSIASLMRPAWTKRRANSVKKNGRINSLPVAMRPSSPRRICSTASSSPSGRANPSMIRLSNVKSPNSLLRGELHQRPRAAGGKLRLPAHMMQASAEIQCHADAEGMRNLLGTCQGGSHLFEGLVRVAEKPEALAEVDAAGDARILPIRHRTVAVALDVVE